MYPFEEQWARRLAGSAAALKSLARVGAALLGIVPLAYVYGWKQRAAYLQAFGAEWMLSLLPPSYFLLTSANVILFAAFWVFMLLVREAQETPAEMGQSPAEQKEAPGGRKTSILEIGFLVFFGASVVASGLSGLIKNVTVVLWVGWITTLCFWSYVVLMTFAIAVSLREGGLKLTPKLALMAVGALAFGFHVIPDRVGSAEGRYDRSAKSRLPLVTLPNGSQRRLLYASESRLFVFDPASDGVRIVENLNALVMRREPTATPSPTPTPPARPRGTPTAAPTP